eukprot:CAMPEP_0182437676 /NCGR_PEP_ID=MMETSP1167-20130531/85208_1 /TAXON_ID=2988 /ORGANISM="Mallomonas Sp, Strain CCMP3275" /LENGTH=356 /DNA_ID=CAMNT_0024630679 /DNA_START=46 /DNA_END=1116 /DNA_ORIENTATION=+
MPLAFFVFVITYIWAASSCDISTDHICESKRFKSSNYKSYSSHNFWNQTLANEWDTHDKDLLRFLDSLVPEGLWHNGAANFDEHLKGVQAILRNWRADEAVSDAGLFHSIYGTEGFQGHSLPLTLRPVVRKVIGDRAERLAWIFCVVDRYSVDLIIWNQTQHLNHLVSPLLPSLTSALSLSPSPSLSHDNHTTDPPYNYPYLPLSDFDQSCSTSISPSLSSPTSTPSSTASSTVCLQSRAELGRFPICLKDEREWSNFLELTLSDWLEQVEGASLKQNDIMDWSLGGAWSYRREAYQRMAVWLHERERERLSVAIKMHEEVFAEEPEHTRHIHQVRTAPVSDAAKTARQAMTSMFI